jgi:hypothetical protein
VSSVLRIVFARYAHLRSGNSSADPSNPTL